MRQNTRAGHLGGLALSVLAAAGFLALAPTEAQAFRFKGETVQGSFDSTISFGVQARMSGRDCGIISNDNGGCVPTTGRLGELVNGPGFGFTSNPDFNYLQADDGNLNYDRGDIVSAALKGTHELALKWPGGWSALVRATWVKDFKADDTNRTPLTDDAKDLAVENWTWLDAYVAKEFDLGGRPAKLRLGNQVISWGEDIFIYGGVNVVNAIDLRKFHTPGTQLKEIFRPAPMASVNFGLSDSVSLEAYYQFRWNAFQFDPVGTFFSGADVVGKGQQDAFIPSSILGAPPGSVGDVGTVAAAGNFAGIPAGSRFTLADLLAVGTVVPQQDDRTPRNGGQYGLAVRIKPESSRTEWGLYYLRYHDKIPFITFVNDPATITANPFGLGYLVDYGEDRDLFGVSMNTKLGNWAVGAELSYRPRDSVGIDPTVPLAGAMCAFCAPGTYRGFVTEKKWQGHLTGFYLLGPSDWGGLVRGLGAGEGFFLGELVAAHYPDLRLDGTIPYFLPDYDLPDKTSAGYVLELGMTYPNAWGSGINVTPQIDFAHDFSGTSPNTIPFVKDRRALTLSLFFNYQDTWKAGVQYTNFWGGGGNNLLKDRDFLSVSLSYSF
ncbi:MAG: DUF1302 domain-containing protein [Rhodocyclales bacterium]|nr:DUF1302 domain-containing protein [Rhodocyclales bacterium]